MLQFLPANINECRKAQLLRALDALGLITTLWMIVRAWLYPENTAWFAAIATVICFWVAIRTVLIYSCGNTFWPAPGMMFLILSLVTNQLGAFVHYQVGWGVMVDRSAAWNMIWGFNLAYLAFALGVFCYAKASVSNSQRLVKEFYERPITVPMSQRNLLVVTGIIFLIGVGASMILLGGRLPILEVFHLMAGGGFDEAKLAAYASREFLNTQHDYRGQAYFDQVRIAIMPMILVFWIIIAHVSRSRLFKIISWVAAAVIIVVLISGLERSPLILFIIQVSVVWMLVVKPQPNIRWAYGFGGTFLAFFGMSVMLGRGAVGSSFSENVVLKLEPVINRIYLSNSLSSVKAFELFPEPLPFRFGGTWLKDIANLMPGPGEGLSAEVYSYLWNDIGSGGVHFVAEMWANGGFLMILSVCFLFGGFTQWVSQYVLGKKEKTPLSLTFYGLMMFCIGLVGFAGLMTAVNRGLITFMLLNAILVCLARTAGRLAQKSPSNHPQQTLKADHLLTPKPNKG